MNVARGQHNARGQSHLYMAGHGQLFRLISRLISMSRLLTDVVNLAGYAEPVTAAKDLDTLHVACEYAGL